MIDSAAYQNRGRYKARWGVEFHPADPDEHVKFLAMQQARSGTAKVVRVVATVAVATPRAQH
jgi:hypothetical protein